MLDRRGCGIITPCPRPQERPSAWLGLLGMSADPDEAVAASAFLALLDSWRRSEPGAADRIFAALYEELHRLAHHHIRRSRPGETLCTTALVHEAYLKLAPRAAVNDRRHFFALASRTMRQILVDQARRHHSQKRGGGLEITTLDEGREGTGAIAAEILALEEALTRLSRVNDRLGQVVELRFFGGLSIDETAEALGSSAATVKRDWRAARAFLAEALGSPP
jgi:RNA polymerase sigma factor (TIGR02999 family)